MRAGRVHGTAPISVPCLGQADGAVLFAGDQVGSLVGGGILAELVGHGREFCAEPVTVTAGRCAFGHMFPESATTYLWIGPSPSRSEGASRPVRSEMISEQI